MKDKDIINKQSNHIDILNKLLKEKDNENLKLRKLLERYGYKKANQEWAEYDGYTPREAKKFAKQEIDEVMEDKEDFVNNLWKESYTDG